MISVSQINYIGKKKCSLRTLALSETKTIDSTSPCADLRYSHESLCKYVLFPATWLKSTHLSCWSGCSPLVWGCGYILPAPSCAEPPGHSLGGWPLSKEKKEHQSEYTFENSDTDAMFIGLLLIFLGYIRVNFQTSFINRFSIFPSHASASSKSAPPSVFLSECSNF